MSALKKKQTAGTTPGQIGELRLPVDRDMTGENCIALEDMFLDTMAEVKETKVILDLSAVNQMDSRGLALCIGLLKECRLRSCAFSIELRPNLVQIFRVVKLDKIFDLKEI